MWYINVFNFRIRQTFNQNHFKTHFFENPPKHPRAYLYQFYDKQHSDDGMATNVETDHIDDIQYLTEALNYTNSEQNKGMSTDNESEDHNDQEKSSAKKDNFPLKKRQRMMEIPYSLEHAFNKSFSAVTFTLEEEFKIIDYLVRIEKYQTMRFDFLFHNFPSYDKLTIAYITFPQVGRKIPFNKQMEKHLSHLGVYQTEHQADLPRDKHVKY